MNKIKNVFEYIINKINQIIAIDKKQKNNLLNEKNYYSSTATNKVEFRNQISRQVQKNDVKNNEIIELQKKVDNNEVLLDELTTEELLKLSELYDNDIEKLKDQFEYEKSEFKVRYEKYKQTGN